MFRTLTPADGPRDNIIRSTKQPIVTSIVNTIIYTGHLLELIGSDIRVKCFSLVTIA